MRMPVNPARLLLMTWPVYLLTAVAVVVNPREWLQATPLTVGVLLAPLLLPLLGLLARSRWSLEATPEALLHHTLTRTERFEWSRMGPIETRAVAINHIPLARTLWFAYPTDAPRTPGEQVSARIGRRLLPVFGDRPLRATAEVLESWRRTARPG